MQDKKNFTLLLVVLAIGGAALWYLQSLPVTSSTPTVTISEQSESGTTTDTEVVTGGMPQENRTTESGGAPSLAPTTPSTKPGASLEGDIDAIEAAADAAYNDAALEATFTSEGANTLVNSYEI